MSQWTLWFFLVLGLIVCGAAAKAVAWEHLVIGFDDYRIVAPAGTVDLNRITVADAARR